MSVIKFPKWTIEAINSQIAHFFWDKQGAKFHLANWPMVSKKKKRIWGYGSS
jgi:hypothetical protein